MQATVLARLQAELRRPCTVGEHTFSLRASIGVAVFPGAGDDAASLLARADAAMYAAKRSGGDTIGFTPTP